MDKDEIKLSIDHKKYTELDRDGVLSILTVRDDGKLVGYYIAMLMIHPHYKDAGLMALTDIYYLEPEYRTGTTAFQMMTAIEKEMKNRGVFRMYTSCKVHKDLTPFFERLGWRSTDYCFTKLLR